MIQLIDHPANFVSRGRFLQELLQSSPYVLFEDLLCVPLCLVELMQSSLQPLQLALEQPVVMVAATTLASYIRFRARLVAVGVGLLYLLLAIIHFKIKTLKSVNHVPRG